jgi:hypothetical protein
MSQGGAGALAFGARNSGLAGIRSCGHEFFLCQWERVKKGLHRGLAEAPAALVGPLHP